MRRLVLLGAAMTSNYHAAFVQFGIDDDAHSDHWKACLARHLGRLHIKYRSMLANACGELERQACMGATDVTSTLLARYSQGGYFFSAPSHSIEWPSQVIDDIRAARKVDWYKIGKARTPQERQFLEGRREVLQLLANAMVDRLRRARGAKA